MININLQSAENEYGKYGLEVMSIADLQPSMAKERCTATYGEFVGMYQKMLAQISSETLNDLMNQTIEFVREVVFDLWNMPVISINVDHKFFEASENISSHKINVPDINVRNKLQNRFNAILEVMKQEDMQSMSFRVTDGINSMYFNMTNSLDESGKIQSIVSIVEFMGKSNVCRIVNIPSEVVHRTKYNQMMGPFAIGKRDRNAESAIWDFHKVHGQMVILDDQWLNMVLNMIIRYSSYDDMELRFPSHTHTERVIFQKIMKRHCDDFKFCSKVLKVLKKSKCYQSTIDLFSSVEINQLPDNIPVVKFSDKEWKFIRKYWDEHFDNDNGIDMSGPLTNMRYGSSMVFTFDDIPMISNINYNADLDICRCILMREEKGKFISSLVVDLMDLKHFHGGSVAIVHSSITVNDMDNIPCSEEELMDIVPHQFFNCDKSVNLILTIMSVYLVIHDRPNRSRVVREETRSKRNSKSANANSKPSGDDVIISRILMPVREAREYAERETVSSNGVERNYVIESWKRIGHYRRLPHSEEKIYIEATTCTRHKQLTDKDVVIRL